MASFEMQREPLFKAWQRDEPPYEVCSVAVRYYTQCKLQPPTRYTLPAGGG